MTGHKSATNRCAIKLTLNTKFHYMETILVTGGAGYIGSHTVIALREAGFRPVIIDNLSNSSCGAVNRIRELANDPGIPFIEADVRDPDALETIFREYPIASVIHFAGYKAVGESTKIPLDYYINNLGSTFTLLEAMKRHGCFKLVFSSSATVYGSPVALPIDESHPLSATNPYGRTKLFTEEILCDLAALDPKWKIALLRYFNPVGAHPSSRIGESPHGRPNNLFPCVTQCIVGKLPELKVYGSDYPTPDGTGVRDYLHVSDLAAGHVAAVHRLDTLAGAVPINLGTGVGYSVLDIVKSFEKIVGHLIPCIFDDRRPGDVAECYANPDRAAILLGWKATRTLDEMCRDSWNWQRQNPKGYEAA